MRTKSRCQKFIVIEDDVNGEVENIYNVERDNHNFDCDVAPHRAPSGLNSRRGANFGSTSQQRVIHGECVDGECFIVDGGPSNRPRNRRYREMKKPARRIESIIDDDLSDCEIVNGQWGRARQDWEEAALRRRMQSVFNVSRCTVESEGSTSTSNLANSGMKESASALDTSESKDEQYSSDQDIPISSPTHADRTSTMVMEETEALTEEREDISVSLNQKGSNSDMHKEVCRIEERPGARDASSDIRDEGKSSNEGIDTCYSTEGLTPVEISTIFGESGVKSGQSGKVAGVISSEGNLIWDRERLKETDDYRQADEEEWARRQLELEMQAEEARREKKRRRLEIERNLEMESRQRKRLAEIRQRQEKTLKSSTVVHATSVNIITLNLWLGSLLKMRCHLECIGSLEEQTSSYKDHMRGCIQSELEHIAASCKDMATLLCRLGVPVEGGPFPTLRQVNNAYKKALLWFHPDRVAAIAKSDIRRQVEAEEKFKLISRMKTVWQPVGLG